MPLDAARVLLHKGLFEPRRYYKALTPFLLGKILELTKGKSLTANIALVRSNAELASKIAIALG